ncbi:DUF2877 domain-containing protein [[Clostridium] hylemonae]|uniref:DUF2877 domain-containing protein n=1 Tax=[Clostridium] hylemonae TaxID=89153 RepID=UPI001106621D|nr:DUF2877 domain-containing protein [[Clostridium] hylemonae]MCB7520963.1 DUF2877 domain-containing protein [[Clostridium] hylemonae]BDF04462.1 hypothetical protein CE91St63_15240 [[Clostridium] hylemonae]
MNRVITHTSTYADNILCQCSSGIVHSVYNKTINIQTEGQLLALQSAASPLSPVSLVTNLEQEDLASPVIRPGQPVRLSGEAVEISSSGQLSVFTYRPVHIYRSGLVPIPSGSSSAALYSQVRMAVKGSDNSGFCLLFSSAPRTAAPNDLMLSAAGKRMSRCRILFREKEYSEAAGVLAGLIGLGIGLTPSGDDFLCGILAALTLCGQDAHPFARALAIQLEGRLSDTNDISRTFLHCALQNQFSQAVCSLPHLPPADEILRNFSAVGHSSGTDTLCGILYALDLLLP